MHSLRLQNYKCFEDQLLEFGALTLFSGLNGMGKSSALQSLLLLRQSHQQGVLNAFGLALNGDLARIGTAQDALFEGAQEDEITFTLALDGNAQARWRFRYDGEANVLGLADREVPDVTLQANLFASGFHYLTAERIGPRTVFEMSDFLVRQQRQIGSQGEYAAHFLSVFGSETVLCEALHHGGAASIHLRDQVEAWLGEVSPGTRLHITPNQGTDLLTLQYSFSAGQQVTNPYRATNVGFGLTYTLPILVAVLSARPGDLLLLENPEAHLHPRGQARMGDMLARAASCGVQVVVETHSDHVLNGIRLAVHDGIVPPDQIAIYYFQRKEDTDQPQSDALRLNIDRDGRIDRWPDGFFDEWDKSLEGLLEPRGD